MLGGDYALAGACPEEPSKRLEELDGVWIRGNTERWLEDPSDAPDDELLHRAIEYCRGELGGKRIEQLFGCPRRRRSTARCSATRRPATTCRPSCQSRTDGDDELLANTRRGGDRLRPQPPPVPARGRGRPPARQPGQRRAARSTAIAAPPTRSGSGGRDVELRRVEYDSDGYAAQVRDRMAEALGPSVETLVRRIEQAAFVQ